MFQFEGLGALFGGSKSPKSPVATGLYLGNQWSSYAKQSLHRIKW